MNQSIKAICFDLDGVYFTPVGKQSFHRALSAEFGGDATAVDEFMLRSSTMREFVIGKITTAEFFVALRDAVGIGASDEELTTRWVRDYAIDPQVQAAVRSARSQGYLTCVCTNNNAARLTALEAKFGFSRDFDMIVSSHEVGYTKPSREIFTALLHRLGIAPADLIYADDNTDRLQGARELGITTFVYEDFEQFVEDLKQLGVHL
jgi:epoxide hydrolase-like predicted phosphatase